MVRSFVHCYLDPSESLLEILFGLILALTLTAGARLLSERPDIDTAGLAAALVGFYGYAWAHWSGASPWWTGVLIALLVSDSC